MVDAAVPRPRTRCSVCNLVPDILREVDRRLLDEGDPHAVPPRPRPGTRVVSAWLLKEHGLRINFKALNDHRNNHLEPAKKAALRMAAAEVVGDGNLVSARAVAQVLDGSPKAEGAVAAVIDRIVADVTLLDRATAETFETLELVNRRIRTRIHAATTAATVDGVLSDVGVEKVAKGSRFDGLITKPEADYLPAALSSIAMAAKARHAILTVKPDAAPKAAKAQEALAKAAGLKALLGNGPPPPIDGDQPDEAASTEPLGDPTEADADGQTRTVIEMPAPPPSGTEAIDPLDPLEDEPPDSDEAPLPAPTRWTFPGLTKVGT